MDKTAVLVKKKNEKTEKMEWALVSTKDEGKVLKWFGTKKPSKEKVDKEERRVQFFKHKKAELLEKMADVSDNLDATDALNFADLMTECMEAISNNNFVSAPLKLRKLGNLLDKSGFFNLAEDVDAFLPDIIELSNLSTKKKKNANLTADKVYKIADKFRNMYIVGEIDEKSFEYKKLQELETLLKSGFVLDASENIKVPSDCSNWWEYFKK